MNLVAQFYTDSNSLIRYTWCGLYMGAALYTGAGLSMGDQIKDL